MESEYRINRREMPIKFMKYLLNLSLVLAFCSCSSIQTSEISDSEINAESAKAYLEVKNKSKVITHPQWTPMLNRVANRIALASGEKFEWEWVLIESNEVNAWCMPGGKIAVYTGIMPILKTEAALAAVLGHEVAHATLRHGKQRYARSIKENAAGLIIGGATAIGGQLLCKTSECRMLTTLGGAAAGLAITFFDRKYSREDESQADQAGQIYMAKAGYDPSEALRLWERMGESHKGQAPPEILSTHPSDSRRKSQLEGWLPRAQEYYRNSSTHYGLGENIR